MPSFSLTDDVKEVVNMNTTQKNQITSLRQQGYGYDRIAQALGLSKNTIKSWCRRNHLSSSEMTASDEAPALPMVFCPVCGKEVHQTPGKREKKFCSDACRLKWWNSHPEKITRRAVYSFICSCCGRQFTAYGNRGRKYCSHACYIKARFGGEHHES